MRITLAIISIILCLWAECHHNSIRQYAEINIPLYMKSRGMMLLFAILCYLIVALDFVAMCGIAWYWSVLISILSHIVLFFTFTLFYEKITDANYSFVSGGSGLIIWIKLIVALILAIVAVII